MTMFIYVVTNNINGKKYVGRTTATVRRRWKKHVSEAMGERDTYRFHKAIRKYGVEAFSIETVATAASLEELNKLEKEWVERLNTYSFKHGYNSTLGGDGCSAPMSPVTKANLSKIRTGMRHTQASKEKISLANKGKVIPPEVIAKYVARWTPELKEAKAAERRATNAIMNKILRDYSCDLCSTSFTQVTQGIWSGHRKACRIQHGLTVQKKHKPHVTDWTPERRAHRSAIAKRNVHKTKVPKDYTCPDCNRVFIQVSSGYYGGHRKYCSRIHKDSTHFKEPAHALSL